MKVSVAIRPCKQRNLPFVLIKGGTHAYSFRLQLDHQEVL